MFASAEEPAHRPSLHVACARCLVQLNSHGLRGISTSTIANTGSPSGQNFNDFTNFTSMKIFQVEPNHERMISDYIRNTDQIQTDNVELVKTKRPSEVRLPLKT